MKHGMKHGKGEYYESLNTFSYEYSHTSKRSPGPLQMFLIIRRKRIMGKRSIYQSYG